MGHVPWLLDLWLSQMLDGFFFDNPKLKGSSQQLCGVFFGFLVTSLWSFNMHYWLVEHEFYDFPFSCECQHPNWLIFFRGVAKNHQPLLGGGNQQKKTPRRNHCTDQIPKRISEICTSILLELDNFTIFIIYNYNVRPPSDVSWFRSPSN